MVSIFSFFLIVVIDRRVNVILDQYIDIEVERLTANIVNRAVNEVMASGDYDSLLTVKNSGNEDERISYNAKSINKLTDYVSLYVYDELINLESGDLDEFHVVDRFRSGRFKNIKKGILCDISLGSIKNSSLFANIGPTIPIKLTFTGQINTELDVSTREYGINNVIVELNVIVKVQEQVTMPLTSEKKDVVVKEPISIEIIKGAIPSYYNGVIS